MSVKVIASGWCCSDCIILIANGETPPEMSEEETAAYVAKVDGRWVMGGEHDADCQNMVDGQWVDSTDCDCEEREFSWSRCDVCGSTLGGSRHAVTLFDK